MGAETSRWQLADGKRKIGNTTSRAASARAAEWATTPSEGGVSGSTRGGKGKASGDATQDRAVLAEATQADLTEGQDRTANKASDSRAAEVFEARASELPRPPELENGKGKIGRTGSLIAIYAHVRRCWVGRFYNIYIYIYILYIESFAPVGGRKGL